MAATTPKPNNSGYNQAFNRGNYNNRGGKGGREPNNQPSQYPHFNQFQQVQPNAGTRVRQALMEKRSHLHFYLHDTHTGKSPTAVRIARLQNITFMNIINAMIADGPLTQGPKLTTKLIGRAQGTNVMAAKNDVALLTVLKLSLLEVKCGHTQK
ncbi:hypothetical protein CMV_030205 [Castanea mollissima]|uniref:Dirigent protein n=1 Tax=Castanea mollissima TaxID=60419 RepID=A0A8J4V3B6_9ROSI|nr:hypothetical protein CMV_030205 [Castanea mollissima]